MVSNKEIIIRMYFKEQLRVVDISKNLNISKSAVTQVLKKDNRYLKEKELRKTINQKRNKEFTKDYMKRKRKNKGLDLDYLILKKLHDQASRELSGGRKPINDRTYRDWNPSIYEYDKKRKSYVLRKNIITGSDVPKRIKWNV